MAQRASEEERLGALRDDCAARILSGVSGAVLCGSPQERLSNNINIRFTGAKSADMLYLLDEAGISVSAGSACQAGVERASHVLLAMGLDEVAASSPLRITLGHTTAAADLDALVEVLPSVVERARVASA